MPERSRLTAGVTLRETHHGNPGERRVLPAGLRVRLMAASNLPADSQIAWWAHPMPKQRWPKDTEDWVRDVGVGLEAADVRLEEPPDVPTPSD